MQWRWRKAQALCFTRHSWIIDWLNIDAIIIKQHVRNHLTFCSVTNHHRDNVTIIHHVWNANNIQFVTQYPDITLLFVAFFALITEASAPGIGIAGFISGLCFLLFFWSQFLSGTAGWLAVCYTGDLVEGEKILQPIKDFGTPFLDIIAPKPFGAIQLEDDEFLLRQGFLLEDYML